MNIKNGVKNPFFSIIVPIYNVEKYLKKCIESILDQTFSDYELILVDDGSTDDSPKICDYYKNYSSAVFVIHKNNGGLSDARNCGTKLAKGDYVIYIDSDDFLSDKKFLQKAYEFLDREKEKIDLLIFGYSKYYENTNLSLEVLFDYKKDYFVGNINEICEKNFYGISAWAKIVRSSLLYENDIEFRKGVYSEDMEWCARILMCSNLCGVLNIYPYQYRQRNDSITKKITEKNIVDIKNNLEICITLKDTCPYEKIESYKNYISMNMSMFIIVLSMLEKNRRKEYYSFINANRFYLKFGTRRREGLIYFLINIVGLENSIRILRLIYNIKNRKCKMKNGEIGMGI